jgi:bifunctional enzyme CysN/CysC
MVRELVLAGEFIEVFVDTPLEECIRRDPKGLYARAKAGQIKNFTGIDSPYERPEQPDLRLDTTQLSLAQAAASVIALLQERQILGWGGGGRGDTQTWI